MSVKSSADAKAIFLAAVENRSPDDWPAFLDEACGDDRALRERVEGLLQAHAENDSLFDRADPTADYQPLEQPGQLIGPYKLRERLGTGGMGVVWAAEQQKPLRRKVALKVIKPGMDSEQVLARFEAEREALALMDHPNIAKILDAGTTGAQKGTGPICRDGPKGAAHKLDPSPFERSYPYFVMELIRGVPITQYCDAKKLTVRERLALFMQVCRAVQHAHQKGIIHRDLKPSNVLVSEQDGQPVPKVIDFGVAKALHQRLTDRSVYTGVFQAIGTLAYMRPEQAGLSVSDIDTRADIYSLGVLLYELLTGSTPFDKDELASAAFDEACRIIREQDPPKPSTKISTLGNRAATISLGRNTDPEGLAKTVRGDLDWIVVKSLDKDRARRYETAGSFAADVERFLTDAPIEARRPSLLYKLTKFSKRNRPLFIVAASVSTAVVGVAALSSMMWIITSSQKVQISKAKKELEEQTRIVRRQRSNSDIRLALDRWERGHIDEALQLLDRNEADLHGIGWNCVWNLCQKSKSAPSIEYDSRHRVAAGSPNGTDFFISLLDGYVAEIGYDGRRLELKRRLPSRISFWRHLAIALSRDGRFLLFPGEDEGEFRIRDVSINPTRDIVIRTKEKVRSVCFVESRGLVAFGVDSAIVLYSLSDGREDGRISVGDPNMSENTPSHLTSSLDGRFVAARIGIDYYVTVVDLNTRGHFRDLPDAGHAWNDIAFSPDGLFLAAGGRQATVRFWDLSTGRMAKELPAVAEIDALAFSAEGPFLYGGMANGVLCCWDLESSQLVSTVRTNVGYVKQIVVCDQGRSLAAFGPFRVQIWHADDLQQRHVARTRQVREVRFFNDERLVYHEIGAREVQETDMQADKSKPIVADSHDDIWSCAVSPSNHLIATGSKAGHIRVYETRTGVVLRELRSGTGFVTNVAISSDGKHLASMGGDGCHIWRMNGSSKSTQLTSASGPSVEFSPDGGLVACGTQTGEVLVFSVENGQEIFRLTSQREHVTSLSFSGDGAKLAAGSLDQTIKVWDTRSGELLDTFDTGGPVWCVKFTPDDKSVLTAGGDRHVHLWDLGTLERRFVFPEMSGESHDIDISPSGKWIAASTDTGSIEWWDVSAPNKKPLERP